MDGAGDVAQGGLVTEPLSKKGCLGPHADIYLSVTARRADTGEPVEMTIGPAGPSLAYDEYWTGLVSWYRRAWRWLRKTLRRMMP